MPDTPFDVGLFFPARTFECGGKVLQVATCRICGCLVAEEGQPNHLSCHVAATLMPRLTALVRKRGKP